MPEGYASPPAESSRAITRPLQTTHFSDPNSWTKDYLIQNLYRLCAALQNEREAHSSTRRGMNMMLDGLKITFNDLKKHCDAQAEFIRVMRMNREEVPESPLGYAPHGIDNRERSGLEMRGETYQRVKRERSSSEVLAPEIGKKQKVEGPEVGEPRVVDAERVKELRDAIIALRDVL